MFVLLKSVNDTINHCLKACSVSAMTTGTVVTKCVAMDNWRLYIM